MSSPQSSNRRKPRKLSKVKKTGRWSPFFPNPLTRSPYFDIQRQPKKRGKKMGRVEDAVGIMEQQESEVGGWAHHPKCMVNEPLDKGPITGQKVLEAVERRDDGWVTEFEFKHDGITSRKGKKRRKRKRRKTKTPNGDGSENITDKIAGTLVVPGVAGLLEEDATGGVERSFGVLIGHPRQGLEHGDIEAGEFDTKKERSTTKKKKKKKKKRTKDSQRMPESQTSMPTKESESPDRVLHPSKKRKRIPAFEVLISTRNSRPPLLPGASTKIISPLPEIEHKKTGERKQKRTKVTDEAPAPEETLEGRILLWFKNNPYPGGIDAHKQLIKPKSQLGEATGGTLLGKSGGVTPILPSQTTKEINPPPSDADLFSKCFVSSEKPEAVLHPEISVVVSKSTRRRKTDQVSGYFASSAKEIRPARAKKSTKNKKVPAGTSIIPWPPLSAETFGLIQEELRSNAFHVLIATAFLNKTRGAVAVPLLRIFLADYPTPLALSQGDLQIITDFLQPLGLQNTRAKRLIEMAKVWIASPPTPGRGVVKYNYPVRDTTPFNFPPSHGNERALDRKPKLGVEQGLEWEIAHLPGVGAYALDSWRIFCRDEFRRSAVSADEVEQEEEWRRVVPKDKELRAYLRWRWAKEGLRWREAGDIEVEVEDETGGEKEVEKISEVVDG